MSRADFQARQRRARQVAYQRIARQEQAGLLTVRQMTDAEREYWGPPQNKPTRLRRRRSLAVPGAGDLDDDGSNDG